MCGGTALCYGDIHITPVCIMYKCVQLKCSGVWDNKVQCRVIYVQSCKIDYT